MCESTVYLQDGEKLVEVMRDVVRLDVEPDAIVCADILGERRAIKNARLRTADLVRHKIILEKWH